MPVDGFLLPLQGSIEQAVAQVEAFRGSLEHRVVARFDEAVSSGDLVGMSECARIMAEFRQGESQLVQARHPCPGIVDVQLQSFTKHSKSGLCCDVKTSAFRAGLHPGLYLQLRLAIFSPQSQHAA